MNGWSALDRFLRTDPRDVGCDEAMEMLHVYVELVAAAVPAASAIRASPRTWTRAARARRTSRGCLRWCATRRTDRQGFRLGFNSRLLPIPRSTVTLAANAAPADVLFNGTGTKLAGTEVGASVIDSFAVGRTGR